MGGFLLWREAAELLGGTGIYIDTAFSSGSVPPPWAKESIAAFGADHVLFGSDNPWSATGVSSPLSARSGCQKKKPSSSSARTPKELLGL